MRPMDVIKVAMLVVQMAVAVLDTVRELRRA
jgi:hypothetical protein